MLGGGGGKLVSELRMRCACSSHCSSPVRTIHAAGELMPIPKLTVFPLSRCCQSHRLGLHREGTQ